MLTEGSINSKQLPGSSKQLIENDINFLNNIPNNNEINAINNNINNNININNASARFYNASGINNSYSPSLDKHSPNNIAPIKKKTISSSIKNFSLYIGSEWWKGILFLLFISFKSILSLLILHRKVSFITKIIEIVLIIIGIILIVINIFSDPGIIPENVLLQNTLKFQNIKLKEHPVKPHILRGRLVYVKICRTCLITRPFGCSHCGTCNICINKFDHHCPWIGNCIGIRNYKTFYYLLHILNINFLLNIILSIQELIQNKNKAILFVGITILIITIFGELFILGLIFSHTYYMLKGHTTYLRLRYKSLLTIMGSIYDNNKGIKWLLYSKLCKRYKKIKMTSRPLLDFTFYCLTNNHTIKNNCNYNYEVFSNNTTRKINPNNIYINCFINNNENINQLQNSNFNNSLMLNNSGMPINNLNNITNNTFMKATFAVNANVQNNTMNDNKHCISCSINPRELFSNTNLNVVKSVHSESGSSSLKKESFDNENNLQNKNSSNDNIFFIDNADQSNKKISKQE